MEAFISRFGSKITGVLTGFDRLVFRGSLLPLIRRHGMYFFLEAAGVRLLDFKKFAVATTERVKEESLVEAHKLDRPIRFLERPSIDKEEFARRLLVEHPVSSGLICVLTALEPCMTFEYHRSKDRDERGLRLRPGKCLHLYKYLLHPRFGFMSARIQTWFPFNVQVCMNGREWLARQLECKGGSDFKRVDNCFTWFSDIDLAQRLMTEQLTTDWPQVLNAIAHSLNPAHERVFARLPMDYYWSAYQTEWATDVMFANPRSLAAIYPALVRHATHHFQSPDVMRFLSRKAHGNFTGELVTSFKNRPEGVRVKHWVNGNSIKMYDKAGSLLRIETTIANADDFKVFRPLQHDESGKCEWRPMRKGVADLHRRAQVSQRANDTYLNALATVADDTPASQVLDQVSRPSTWRGRRVRPIRIGDTADLALLQAISHGEFTLAGFRNRDLREILHPAKRLATVEDARRLSARVSRQIRLLRAHGVVHKVPKSHRYKLSPHGQLLTAALFAIRTATVQQLIGKAA